MNLLLQLIHSLPFSSDVSIYQIRQLDIAVDSDGHAVYRVQDLAASLATDEYTDQEQNSDTAIRNHVCLG